MKRHLAIGLFLLLIVASVSAQTNALQIGIEKVIADKKAEVGVAVCGMGSKDTLSINGDRYFPMISVFKFHIALTVLDKVDKGVFALDQKLFVRRAELLDNTWSPFRDKYPNGDVSITLEEALQWMVVHSDNNLCDVLIRFVGGTEVVSDFIHSPDFVIKNNEEDMHKDWESQFVNTTTPLAAAVLLKRFYEGELLSKENTAVLYRMMVQTTVGQKRLKAKLPTGTEVAHRTGSSFTSEEGVTGATNDVGIVKLPNGQYYTIAVFVHNSSERPDATEQVIADISKVVWDYFNGR